MTAREQRRARVLSRILKGELTMAEGSVELGLSERQLWRLRAALVELGPAGGRTAGGSGRRARRSLAAGRHPGGRRQRLDVLAPDRPERPRHAALVEEPVEPGKRGEVGLDRTDDSCCRPAG